MLTIQVIDCELHAIVKALRPLLQIRSQNSVSLEDHTLVFKKYDDVHSIY